MTRGAGTGDRTISLVACTLAGMNSGTPICLQQHRGRGRRARAIVVEANFASAVADASRPEDGSAAASNELGADIVGRAVETAGWACVSTDGEPGIFGLHESLESGDKNGADATGSLDAAKATA